MKDLRWMPGEVLVPAQSSKVAHEKLGVGHVFVRVACQGVTVLVFARMLAIAYVIEIELSKIHDEVREVEAEPKLLLWRDAIVLRD
jgi:hypothetical protein